MLLGSQARAGVGGVARHDLVIVPHPSNGHSESRVPLWVAAGTRRDNAARLKTARETPLGMSDLLATTSISEAAAALGIGRNQACQAAARGELPVLRLVRRPLVPIAPLRRMLGLVIVEAGVDRAGVLQ